MVGAFFVPLAHLAFDDTWIDPVTSFGQFLLSNFREKFFIPFFRGSWPFRALENKTGKRKRDVACARRSLGKEDEM